MSKFSLISASTSTTEAPTPVYIASPEFSSDEEDNLPYPTELPRSDFLQDDFDPQEYLSSLKNRHQTLEDLRTDLRTRSQQLNQELLDLVNGNYEEFLSLGSDLSGGEEKVEGVRVGLLGFTRDLEALQSVVASREDEVSTLLADAKKIRREIVFGRKLLDFENKVSALEATLGIIVTDLIDDDIEADDEDEELDSISSATKTLSSRCETYLVMQRQMEDIGEEHPYVQELLPRTREIRKILLLDLTAATRQARTDKKIDDMLHLTQLFATIGAEREAIQTLKTK